MRHLFTSEYQILLVYGIFTISYRIIALQSTLDPHCTWLNCFTNPCYNINTFLTETRQYFERRLVLELKKLPPIVKPCRKGFIIIKYCNKITTEAWNCLIVTNYKHSTTIVWKNSCLHSVLSITLKRMLLLGIQR